MGCPRYLSQHIWTYLLSRVHVLRHRRPRGCKEEVLDSKWAGFDACERCESAERHCSEVLGIANEQPSGIDGCHDGHGRCWRRMGVYI